MRKNGDLREMPTTVVDEGSPIRPEAEIAKPDRMPALKRPATDATTQRLLVAVAAFVAITAVYGVRVADPDIWGHLRYGRLFLESSRVPVADPFAYTTTGLTWYAHEYLAQVLLWLTYAGAGPLGLIALKCLVGGAATYVIYRSIRLGSDDVRLWGPILMLATSLLGRYFLFRPQLFTYLWFALFVLIVLRYLYGRRAPLWVLPPLLALWANLHGGFIAGIGVLGLAWGLRGLQSYYQHGLRLASLWHDTRALLATLVACLGASLLTPLGWRLWPFLLVELSNHYNRRFIEEWQPLKLSAPGWSGGLALLLLALTAIAWLLAQQRVVTIAGLRPWQWLLSNLPFTVMAFQSNRHVPILVIWITPVLALLAQAAWDAWGETRTSRRALLLVTSLIGVPALIAAFHTLSDPLPRIRITRDSLGLQRPFGAVAFMRANALHGNVYTPLWWGSYLTWELYPGVLVSTDGRNDTLFPVEMVGENLVFYLSDAADLDAPLRYATDFLLVHTGAPILPRLRADKRWSAIYEDPEAILFLRADDAHAELLDRYRAGELQVPTPWAPQFFQ